MQLGLEPSMPVTNLLSNRCREERKDIGLPEPQRKGTSDSGGFTHREQGEHGYARQTLLESRCN